MATSLGYVLMNWTSTFSQKKRKKKSQNKKPETKTETETVCCQTSDFACLACEEKVLTLNNLSSDLQSVHNTVEDLKKKLNVSHVSLATSMDKENKLRDNHETLILEEAQARYELDQLKRQLSEKLQERDEAHAERMRLLESTLQDKECEWAKRNEALRKDLRQAIRCSIADTERETESLENLEQEIESLRMVVDMRSTENRELRIHNNELMAQVDRLKFLESELANAKQRLDEMTLVLQHKMDSERELLELSETLQSELVKTRSDALHVQNNVENSQFLQNVLLQSEHNNTMIPTNFTRPPLKVQHSHSDLSPQYRNQHQQASSGNTPKKSQEDKKNLIMNVREKTESVAWSIQMPTNASPSNQRRKTFKTK